MKPLDPCRIPLCGTNLIEASAGTGKTYAITTLYVRLVLESRLPVEEILVVTYTRAATAELRDRVRRRLAEMLDVLTGSVGKVDENLARLAADASARGTALDDTRRLRLALRDFDRAAILTIHGFCQRTLQDSAFESGVSFDIELASSQAALLDEVTEDFWARELCDASHDFVRSLRIGQETVNLASLRALAGRLASAGDLGIVDDIDLAAQPDAPNAAQAWAEAHRLCTEIWQAQRWEVCNLLLQTDALKKTSHKPETMADRWFPALDNLLRSGVAGPLGDSPVKKLATSGLRVGTKQKHVPPVHPFFDACEALQNADDALRGELEHQRRLFLRRFVDYVRTELVRRNVEAGTQGFDELLVQMREALRKTGGADLARKLRDRYRAALIDEFQDTDPVQYEVFRRIYHEDSDGSRPLFLIGDPKQAIYAFRGADLFTYLEARGDAGERCYAMDTNWRSDPSLVDAVNTVFSSSSRAFLYEAVQFQPVKAQPDAQDRYQDPAGSAAMEVWLFEKEQIENADAGNAAVIEATVCDIARILTQSCRIGEERVRPGDIAVLCRANKQANNVWSALREAGIPSVLETDESVFETDEAEELERVLRAIAEPGNASLMRAALATSLLGVSADELHRMRQEDALWDQWTARFHGWHRIWHQRGFVQCFRQLLRDAEIPRRLLRLRTGQRSLTNLYHLGELLQEQAVSDKTGPLLLLHWLGVMRKDARLRVDNVGDSSQIRLESDADAVQIVTVHKSKGLEYPIVYCPFSYSGGGLFTSDKRWLRFHDADDGHRLKLDLGSADKKTHEDLAEQEALAEALRLLYVALTRAKHRCVWTWGAFYGFGASALAFLLHGDPATDTAPGALKAFTARVKLLEDAELRERVEMLARHSAGAIRVVPASSLASGNVAEGGLALEDGFAESLAPRQSPRVLRPSWRATSFSALVAETTSVPATVHDHDMTGDPLDSEIQLRRSRAILLADMPRGRSFGQMIHGALEDLDFGCEREALGAVLKSKLASFGMPSDLAPRLTDGIWQALHTPLAPMAVSLGEVTRAERLDELEFHLPVRSDAEELVAADIARVLAQRQPTSGPVPYSPAYVDRVRQLGFPEVRGYLRGFIDLVFRHQGRFYLVDYKSNDLGGDASDYSPHRLQAQMEQHHYVFQYHLYLVALHRYLTVRVASYQYDRDFGGVGYLFLRGMHPEHEPGCGVFFDRPPLAAVEALSAVLDSGREKRGAR